MVLDKRTSGTEAVGYILAQIIGAIAAAVVVLLDGQPGRRRGGHHQAQGGISDIGALILEAIFTAMFLLVILTASKPAGTSRRS